MTELAVVAECYVKGVSTRKVDKIVQQLGVEGISKSQVTSRSSPLLSVCRFVRTARQDGAVTVHGESPSVPSRSRGAEDQTVNHLFVATLALGASLLFGVGSAHAMHCGNRLVSRGDISVRVLQLCGEPAHVQTRVVHRTRRVSQRVAARRRGGVVVSDEVTVSVAVERWTYDFGPQRFMRVLVFEDGVLVQMDTAGYGTSEGRPR